LYLGSNDDDDDDDDASADEGGGGEAENVNHLRESHRTPDPLIRRRGHHDTVGHLQDVQEVVAPLLRQQHGRGTQDSASGLFMVEKNCMMV